LNVVDSSAWLEYFADGPNAARFASAIEDTDSLLVPTICLVEVFKKLLREKGEAIALEAVVAMRQATVEALDNDLALQSARLGLSHKLPLADSIVLATARRREATVWTQDSDFEGLEKVEYFAKTDP
jgi:predicted nucleic acid-binding protein